MLVKEGSEQAGENILRDRSGDSEGQFSGDFAIFGAEFAARPGKRERRFSWRRRAGADPCASEGDAIAGAIEEANAEIVFERLDLQRDGRLGEKKMFRGLAKIQMFGDGAKNLEAEIFQLRHGMIIHGKGKMGISSSSDSRLCLSNPAKFALSILRYDPERYVALEGAAGRLHRDESASRSRRNLSFE